MAHAYRSMLPLAVLALLAAGCPGDDSSTEDTTTNASTASGTDTGTATASGTDTATATITATSTATDTASGSGDSTGPGTTATDSGGAACGEATCNAAEFCDWGVNSCGAQDFDEGACAPSPEGCDAVYQPVCGCDGEVHGNECEANTAGVDVDAAGECTAPEGYFACGFRFCDTEFEYCQIAVSDVGGEPDGFSCQQPSEACDPIRCDCLMGEPCFEFSCEETPDGGIEIVCPGG